MPHLHMRGEYEPAFYYPYQLDGSSPHAWGILAIFFRPGIENRFIPTCVGNTAYHPDHLPLHAVHPHVRGEYSRPEAREKASAGSSPRAWGILHGIGPAGMADRFIPTCVGNTSIRVVSTPAASVHPHVRGEYVALCAQQAARPGSSPRAWGIRFLLFFKLFDLRFIPTCVGNTGAVA